ncbi:MAG: Type restriction modification specificity domain protein [Candidatus Saccharibacteria bacterium]|nr:Type restriction modification specificity domain protein [Candidatus Saccharibacteria bacterium]
MTRRIVVGSIATLNQRSINQADKQQRIAYLDTGNLTRNIIDEVKLIAPGEPLPSRAQRKVQDNTIIYSTVRPNLEHHGFIDTARKHLIVSTGFTTIDVTDKDVDAKFLYYALTQKPITYFLHRIASGSVSSYPSISPDDLADIALEIPSDRTEQKKIATILSLIDKKIETNSLINKRLSLMADSLFEYWFLQFDFPDQNGKPYRSSGGAMVYNPVLKMHIPADWSAALLADFIAHDKSGDWGYAEATSEHDQRVVCIRGADINSLNGLAQSQPPQRYIAAKNSHKLLEPNDVIIEISGGSPSQSTGRIAYVTEHSLGRFSDPLVTSNFCKALTLKNPTAVYYLSHLWQMLYRRGVFFNYEGKTSGIKNLLFDSFAGSYLTVRPKAAVLRSYYEINDVYEQQKQALLAESAKLGELRDWLLPMLVNGQLTIAR